MPGRVHFPYVGSEAHGCLKDLITMWTWALRGSGRRRLLGKTVLFEFLMCLFQRCGGSADIIWMCNPAPLLQTLDSVGLSVCQLLDWVLNAILFVQVSSADVRQVSRLVENCPDFGW